MTSPDDVVREALARVAQREADGAYDGLEWLDADIEPRDEDETPVDVFLQYPRPTAPWTRRRAMPARAAAPGLPDWEEASRQADAHLREAIAWLRLSVLSEQRTRELQDLVHSRDIETTARRVDRVEALTERLQRLIDDDLVPRVRTLEVDRSIRRAATPQAPAPTGQPTPGPAAAPTNDGAADFDYLGFEDRFRGPEAVIRERLAHHVPRFIGHGPVMDLGCGRGEWLSLLAEAGVEATGVDADLHMARAARDRGLDVTTGDLFTVLADQPPESLGAITAFHVIEHIPLSAQLQLIRLARAALRPGGLLLLETPNPLSLVAGSINFLRDPTHVRPLHPDTLAFMMESEGFASAEIEQLAPVPADARTPRVAAPSPVTGEINRALDAIDAVLFGFQDVAVIGTR